MWLTPLLFLESGGAGRICCDGSARREVWGAQFSPQFTHSTATTTTTQPSKKKRGEDERKSAAVKTTARSAHCFYCYNHRMADPHSYPRQGSRLEDPSSIMATVANAVSATSASLDSLAPNTVPRYAPGDWDVAFDVKFCGICESRAIAQAALPPSCCLAFLFSFPHLVGCCFGLFASTAVTATSSIDAAPRRPRTVARVRRRLHIHSRWTLVASITPHIHPATP